MAITLTEAAAGRIRQLLDKRGKGLGLRLGVRKSGCSGYAYQMDYADEVGDGDTVFEGYGVQVVVDHASLPTLEGTVVDYTRDGLNENFRFRNPNVKDECGCGESFNV